MESFIVSSITLRASDTELNGVRLGEILFNVDVEEIRCNCNLKAQMGNRYKDIYTIICKLETETNDYRQ